MKVCFELSKTDKVFFAYITVFFIASAFVATFNSLSSDEGTHLLLSLFYKDLITHMISTGDFSFGSAYSYAINYLVHYPKLQIAYPPLYHLTNAFFFSIFGPSSEVGRLVNLAYAVLGFTVFYFLAKEYFDEKAALVATLLFSLSPFTLFYSNRAWLDYSFIFFFITSLWLFSKAVKTNRNGYFVLCGFATGLALLGKQMGGFLLLFYAAILLLRNDGMGPKLKRGLMIFVPFLAIALPYLLILYASGGLNVNAIVASFYANVKGQPTSFLDPMFWLYYFVYTVTAAPFFPLILAGFAYYAYKKRPHWKEMLIFFIVIYVCTSAVPTKELRFSEAFMLPAYATAGVLLASAKRKIIIPIAVAAYFTVSAILLVPTIGYYPVENITGKMMADIPANSSIALLSDEDPAFSSVFMWYVALNDRNVTHKVYRPCAFDDMNATDMNKAFKENGVYYVVYSEWSSHKSIDLIRDKLTYLFSETANGLKTDVYNYNEYSSITNSRCNYICLTQEQICAE